MAHPEDHHLPHGHPAARWFLVSQLVVELTRCTVDTGLTGRLAA
ncbi:hypothetical protein [Streptomyces sp. PT12]|nr:hypothetical protein [Streptomyces sp. PT12]